MSEDKKDLKRPYLDFYKNQNISPVHQDVTDLKRHFSRRESLYRLLGLPSSFVEGRSVIEFGPGPGFNSLYTASLKPAEYYLVDGNPRSIEGLKQNFQDYKINANYKIISSLIEEYPTDKQFDLVICEGAIPFQIDPTGFVKRLGKFVKPGGVLFITCIDAISFLGESLRRLVAMRVSPFSDSPDARINALEKFFKPHLSTLIAMSRPVKDWLEDNILIKYYGKFFSISDAIDALDGEFEVYHSSPHFLTEMRWYKSLYGQQRKFNQLAKEQYYSNIPNFMDYRQMVPVQRIEYGKDLLQKAEKVFSIMLEMEEKGDTAELRKKASETISEISKEVRHISYVTSTALDEVVDFMTQENVDTNFPFSSFQSFFGRGQQYLSFTKSNG